MRNATAGAAVDRGEGAVSPDVLRRGFWMALDFHAAECEVHPRAADPATERAVAGCGHLRRGREGQTDGAAMARAFVHSGGLLQARPQEVDVRAERVELIVVGKGHAHGGDPRLELVERAHELV